MCSLTFGTWKIGTELVLCAVSGAGNLAFALSPNPLGIGPSQPSATATLVRNFVSYYSVLRTDATTHLGHPIIALLARNAVVEAGKSLAGDETQPWQRTRSSTTDPGVPGVSLVRISTSFPISLPHWCNSSLNSASYWTVSTPLKASPSRLMLTSPLSIF